MSHEPRVMSSIISAGSERVNSKPSSSSGSNVDREFFRRFRFVRAPVWECVCVCVFVFVCVCLCVCVCAHKHDYTLLHTRHITSHTQWLHVPCMPRLIASFVNILLHTRHITTHAQWQPIPQWPRLIGTFANIFLHTRHITTHTHDNTYCNCPD